MLAFTCTRHSTPRGSIINMKLQYLDHLNEEEYVAKTLMQRKCSLNVQDELFIIVKDPETNINKPDDFGLYPIHRAMLINDPVQFQECLNMLIERGVDVNVRTLKEGSTPLHIAVSRSHIPTLSLLLQLRPNYDLPDHNGKTPYEIAYEMGSEGIIELLDSYQENVHQILRLPKTEGFPKQVIQSTCTCTIL